MGLYLKDHHKQKVQAHALDFSLLGSKLPPVRRPNAPLLPRPRSKLTEDMKSLSLCHAQDRFVLDGCAHVLHSLFTEATNDTCLTLVAEACIWAQRWRQSHSEADRKKSTQKYVSALQATNMALCSPTDAVKDDTLAAVGLFRVYEVCHTVLNAAIL